MTMTGRTLGEYAAMGAGGRLALVSFLLHLPVESATWRALNEGDETPFYATPLGTSKVLMDVFDAINGAAYNVCVSNGAKCQKPDPYPRPNEKKGGKRHIDADVMTIEEFEESW